MYFLLVSRKGVQREQTSVFYLCQGLGADSAELGNLVIALQCGLGQVASLSELMFPHLKHEGLDSITSLHPLLYSADGEQGT